jgi:Cu+-exporting ATPase
MRMESPSCDPCESAGLPAFGFRIGIALALAGQGMVFGLGYNNALETGDAPLYGTLLYVVLHGALFASAVAVVLLLGGPLFQESLSAIRQRKISVEALFVLSAGGAMGGSLISSLRGSGSVYYEVVSIVLCVYAIGKQIGAVQRGRVSEAVSSFRHAFDSAVILGPDGRREQKPVSQIKEGDRVAVRPGDPIPVDGLLLEGGGYVRETALTGEPAPVTRKPGDRLLAGTWSVDGNFVIQAKSGHERGIDQILQLLESAPETPSRLQESADQLMRVFVPVVSLTATGTFFGWLLLSSQPWWDALFNAMAVLLVACPCALGLAMPSGIWAGLYALGQRGLVGRHGHLLDSLASCTMIVFDKTGTLSHFDLEVDTRHLVASGAETCPEESGLDLKAAIASLGKASHHPVSSALSQLSESVLPVQDLRIYPGEGMGGNVGGIALLVGETSLLERAGAVVPQAGDAESGKPVHVAVNGSFTGTLYLKEVLREEAEATLQALQSMGCRCRILSGDPSPLHAEIGGCAVEGSLTPSAKADRISALERAGEHVLFIGDGVNDLPAMEASRAALAVDLGAALATEYADGLLVDGRVGVLPSAIRRARRIMKHLQGNLRFALAYNLVGMTLAAAGVLHPVVAALLMVGSSVIVSARALHAAGQAG